MVRRQDVGNSEWPEASPLFSGKAEHLHPPQPGCDILSEVVLELKNDFQHTRPGGNSESGRRSFRLWQLGLEELRVGWEGAGKGQKPNSE